MSMAMRSSLLTTVHRDYFSEYLIEQQPSVFSTMAMKAADACMAFVSASALPAPNFLWTDHQHVELTPSDYHLRWLEDFEELVTIEELDIPLRAYCHKAAERLAHYRTLEAGWDGDDMPAPQQFSIDGASDFLVTLTRLLDTCPEIDVLLDHEGIVSLVFDRDHLYCSIAFYEDSEVVTYNLNRISGESFTSEFHMEDTHKLMNFVEYFSSL
ncbi:hypothetical protein [Pseudomonas putida]|uniref:hypothetical protein n=1 Tax=Pseudomonas putida TaxID=303 RepID=UPI003D03389F